MGLFSSLFGGSKPKQNTYQQRPQNTPNVKVTMKPVANPNPQIEIPPLQGDYAKANFLNLFSKPKQFMKNGEYAQYFLYEMGIRNCEQYGRELIAAGYLSPIEGAAAYENYKLPELKSMLEQLGLPVSGKKAALIDRIMSCGDPDFIKNHTPKDMYQLSDMGRAFVEQHDAYVQIHRHRNNGISWQEYDKVADKNADYLTNMWKIFNQKLSRASLIEQRSIYLNMHNIMNEEGKNSDALELLLKVLYIDFSGHQFPEMYDLYRRKIYSKSQLLDMFNVVIMVAPGLLEYLNKFKDFYDSEMIDVLYSWRLPVQITKKEVFETVVECYMNGSLNYDGVCKTLQLEYNKFVDNYR